MRWMKWTLRELRELSGRAVLFLAMVGPYACGALVFSIARGNWHLFWSSLGLLTICALTLASGSILRAFERAMLRRDVRRGRIGSHGANIDRRKRLPKD